MCHIRQTIRAKPVKLFLPFSNMRTRGYSFTQRQESYSPSPITRALTKSNPPTLDAFVINTFHTPRCCNEQNKKRDRFCQGGGGDTGEHSSTSTSIAFAMVYPSGHVGSESLNFQRKLLFERILSAPPPPPHPSPLFFFSLNGFQYCTDTRTQVGRDSSCSNFTSHCSPQPSAILHLAPPSQCTAKKITILILQFISVIELLQGVNISGSNTGLRPPLLVRHHPILDNNRGHGST